MLSSYKPISKIMTQIVSHYASLTPQSHVVALINI